MPDTVYIVLRRTRSAEAPEDRTNGWLVVDSTVQAASAETAIRKAAKEDGVYVAVPARSFKPVNVESVQQTVLKLNHQPESS